MQLHEPTRLFLPTSPPQFCEAISYVGEAAEGRVIAIPAQAEERVILTTEANASLDVVKVVASGHPAFNPGDVAVCVPYSGIWYSRPRFVVGADKARVYGYQPNRKERERLADPTTQLIAIMDKEANTLGLRPTGTNVIIRSPRPADTVGGLYIPDDAKAAVNYGVVDSVGGGRLDRKGQFIEPKVKPGDQVLAFDRANAYSYQEGDEIITIVDSEAIHIYATADEVAN